MLRTWTTDRALYFKKTWTKAQKNKIAVAPHVAELAALVARLRGVRAVAEIVPFLAQPLMSPATNGEFVRQLVRLVEQLDSSGEEQAPAGMLVELPGVVGGAAWGGWRSYRG